MLTPRAMLLCLLTLMFGVSAPSAETVPPEFFQGTEEELATRQDQVVTSVVRLREPMHESLIPSVLANARPPRHNVYVFLGPSCYLLLPAREFDDILRRCPPGSLCRTEGTLRRLDAGPDPLGGRFTKFVYEISRIEPADSSPETEKEFDPGPYRWVAKGKTASEGDRIRLRARYSGLEQIEEKEASALGLDSRFWRILVYDRYRLFVPASVRMSLPEGVSRVTELKNGTPIDLFGRVIAYQLEGERRTGLAVDAMLAVDRPAQARSALVLPEKLAEAAQGDNRPRLQVRLVYREQRPPPPWLAESSPAMQSENARELLLAGHESKPPLTFVVADINRSGDLAQAENGDTVLLSCRLAPDSNPKRPVLIVDAVRLPPVQP